MKRANKLTEAQWYKVFKLRCESKRGIELSSEERKLVDVAYKEDSKRYAAMEPDIFDATVPFGSCAKSRRGPDDE